MTAATEPAGGRTERSTWVLPPAVVFLVLMGLATVGAVLARNVVNDQEARLLDERTNEVAELLTNSVTRIEAPLHVLASVVSIEGSNPELFTEAAATEVETGGGTVFAVSMTGGEPEVVAGVGNPPPTGTVLQGGRAELAERALAEDDIVAMLFEEPESTYLGYAVSQDEMVVMREAPVNPGEPVPDSPESPFSQLRLAVYLGSDRDPENLILTTESTVPISGEVVQRSIPVGGEELTVAVGSREPLVGSFASNFHWIMLAGGFVSALLATAVTVVLSRRRAYAYDLVASRTADLRSAREAADEANRSKSEFLSRMSHELRTPLNAVLGFGQILEFDDLTESQQEAVGHILKGGQHLLELINEVLDISRIEAGNIALSPEPVLADELVNDSLDLIQPLAAQRGIQVKVEGSGHPDEHVFADRQRTKQVLLNLLSNAVKYNRQRGSVTITSSVIDEGSYRISVTDTGPGISADNLDLLFVPFERLGAEQTDTEGTGIGLVLSKKLAEAMDGTLGVESVPGKGSTFWLDLPRVESPVDRYGRLSGPGAGAADETTGEVSEGRETVLHIEDNLSNLKLVELICASRPQVEVVAAMQGRIGLELAQQHHPKLVLLDLHLPDMGGEQILQMLRDDPETASIPVVIISADATQGQIQRLLAAGAAAYLTKPIEVPELLRVLDDALRRP